MPVICLRSRLKPALNAPMKQNSSETFSTHEHRPLATVVIINYNYEKFVAAAIDSALEQSYEPLEVIVVDDGSTDGSREIISSYGGRIRTLFQENGGQGA